MWSLTPHKGGYNDVAGATDEKVMTRREVILFAVVAMGLVLFGNQFVLERSLGAQLPVMQIRDDALQYAQMAEGATDEVYQAYRYRVFVPLVAKFMPGPALDSLKLVTLISLALAYFCVLVLCYVADIDNGAAIAALCLVFSSHANLYQFHNPFLTDATGLLWVTLALIALAIGAFSLLATTTVVGLATRESHLFLLPVAFFADVPRRYAALLVIVATGALVAIRLAVGKAPDQLDLWPYIVRNFEAEARLVDLRAFLVEIYRSWDYLWMLSIAGLVSLSPSKVNRRILIAGICLFVGGMAASLVAADTTRMFYGLFPIMALGCARLLGGLCGRQRRIATLLFYGLAGAQLMTYYPTIAFNFARTAGWEWRFALYPLGLIVTVLFLIQYARGRSKRTSEGHTLA